MLDAHKKVPSPELRVCPYLGIREDQETSFAFPSIWNCCHLSRQVAPVTLGLQNAQCLTENYSRCPVYMGGEKVRLPSKFRLKRQADESQRRLGLSLLFLILLTGAGVLWAVSTGDLSATAAGLWSGVGTAVSGLRGIPPATPVIGPAAATASDIPSPTPAVVEASETPLPSTQISSIASPTPNGFSTAATVCGYGLDTPINTGNYQFVIHKVSEGESIDLLESKFDTTKNAIQAANYFLPMPLWVDMVIVVPVGSADIANMPPFEPYFVAQVSVSLETLAKSLAVDAGALKEYNGWNSVCRAFSGWILIPRERTSP